MQELAAAIALSMQGADTTAGLAPAATTGDPDMDVGALQRIILHFKLYELARTNSKCINRIILCRRSEGVGWLGLVENLSWCSKTGFVSSEHL